MLRALHRFLGTRRAGDRRQLRPRRVSLVDRAATTSRPGCARVFAGEYRVDRAADARGRGRRRAAASPSTTSSSRAPTLGRMVELDWAVGGEATRPRQPATASSARPRPARPRYNLSNGGPVLVWGLDAMAVTFVAPHSLHARAARRAARAELIVWNRTPDVSCDRARRRAPSSRDLGPGRPGGRALGDAALAARDAARGDVLQPLPPRPLLRSLRIENLVLDPGGGARARPRAERDHRRDRRRARRSWRRRSGCCSAPRATPDDRRCRAARRTSRRSSTCPRLPRRRRARARSQSCGPRTSPASCSRGGSSPTAARAPTRGAGPSRARTSRPPPSG